MSTPTNDINLHSVPCCGSCLYQHGYLEDPDCRLHDMRTSHFLICDQYVPRPAPSGQYTIDDVEFSLESRATRAEYKRLEELG